VFAPQPFSIEVFDLNPLRALGLPTALIAVCPSGEISHSPSDEAL